MSFKMIVPDNLTLKQISDTSQYILKGPEDPKPSSIKDILPLITEKKEERFYEEEEDNYESLFDLLKSRASSLYLVEQINPIHILEVFDSQLIATILEDTIMCLRIIMECTNDVRLRHIENDMPKLLAKKFGYEDAIDEALLFRRSSPTAHKLAKITNDRNKILEVLEKTFLEIVDRNSWKPISEWVFAELSAYNEVIRLIEEERANIQKLRGHHKEFVHLRNYYKTKHYEVDQIKRELQLKLEDASEIAEAEIRYTESWSNSRVEQGHLSCHLAEKRSMETIQKHKRLHDFETRVHNEIEHLYNTLIIETLDKMDYWMDKYESDMETIDLKIQFRRSDYLSALQKREQLEKIIDSHEAEMDDWKEFLAERRAKEEYKQAMHRNAEIIQAWWRGIICRQKLGPYRPKPKTDKKNNKKDKTKKR